MPLWPLVKRELRSYFNSPIAYITTLVFLVGSTGWFFFLNRFFTQNTSDLRGFFYMMPMIFVVLIPAMTMRSWAEERKLGTIELLVTMPAGEWTLACAKFLGSFILLAITLALTLPVPVMISLLGNVDWGQIATEYFGVLLTGGSMIALGSFVSSLTRNQISAFIFTVLALFVLAVAGNLAAIFHLPRVAGDFVRWVWIFGHTDNFSKGVIDTRDLLYFIVSAAAFLFLTAKTILFRKWR